jgi:hypothetical protein
MGWLPMMFFFVQHPNDGALWMDGWMDGCMYGLKLVWVLPLKTFDINHDQTKGSFVWLWAIEKEFDSISK